MYGEHLMGNKSLDDLGELQRAVIEIIWDLGAGRVHQVRKLHVRKRNPHTRRSLPQCKSWRKPAG